MRICYLSAGPFAHVGAYIDHFQRAGHDVHFVALSPSPDRPVAVHDAFPAGAHAKWKYPLSFARARAVIRRLKPDIVHAHYATSGGLASLVCGFHPTIVTAHGTDLTAGVSSRVWRPLLKRVFDHADRVNTVSDDLKAMAVSLGVPETKVSVLTPGVDTDAFSPAPGPRRAGPPRLLCNRRLEAVYDPLTVVCALAELKKRGLAFEATLAGDGALAPAARALVEAAGLGGRVRLAGAVAPERMPALLREHDVYLSASRWDGTSLSLLEAMATGLFPVVSRIPANRAWLEHGAGGLLHAPGDARDLADQIELYVRRPELGAVARELNRAKVVAFGDRRTNMARLELAYRELVDAAR